MLGLEARRGYIRFMKYVILLASLTVACATSAQETPSPLDLGPKEALTISTENGEHKFSVEIADSQAEQNRGLMFRDNLPVTEGMLFEFNKPRIASIWMKNTAIPLDILFVRSNGKILKIEHSAVPYSLRSASSETVVGAVLELAGGTTKDLGITAGDEVVHEFFNNVKAISDE